MKRVFIVIRRSENYFHGKMNYVKIQNSFYQDFRKGVIAWNLLYGMPYLEFRRKLSDIAYSSYPMRSIDGIFHWFNWDAIKDLGKDTWVFPIDEDDFLAPNTIDYLKELEEHEFYWWVPPCVGADGNRFRKYPGTIASCSYVVKMPIHEACVEFHKFATKMEGVERFKINKPDLSFWLKGVSSVSFLSRKGRRINEIFCPAKEKSFIKKVKPLKIYFPLIDKYNELLEELYDSFKG
jgi:hypothetical protein